MRFEWDSEKAEENLRKHGVSFDEATVTFGISSSGRLLIVSHTERGDTIRIINARLMTRAEMAIYEEGQP